MNHDLPAVTPASALQLHELLRRWIRLAEAGLSQIEESRPEAMIGLENLSIEQAGLLEQWHELEQQFSTELQRAQALHQQAESAVELRLAAQQAVAINRRIGLALRSRERFMASRLEALLSAAGTPGIYSSAGSVQRAMTSGGTVIAT